MFRSARIDNSGTYRVTLVRWWDQFCTRKCCVNGEGPFPGYIAWVLNNPSTADGKEDDATIRKLWSFSRLYGFNAMQIVNTNPYRATDPKDALIPPEESQAANDQWLAQVHTQSYMTICAWGDKANPALVERAVKVMHPIGPLHALRVTKQGNPQHPLYLPGTTTPKPWKPEKWIN